MNEAQQQQSPVARANAEATMINVVGADRETDESESNKSKKEAGAPPVPIKVAKKRKRSSFNEEMLKKEVVVKLSEAEVYLDGLVESEGDDLIYLCKSKERSQKIQKMLRKDEVKTNLELKWKLIRALKTSFAELMKDNYGNFVFQGLICNAENDQIDFILQKVVKDLNLGQE